MHSCETDSDRRLTGASARTTTNMSSDYCVKDERARRIFSSSESVPSEGRREAAAEASAWV